MQGTETAIWRALEEGPPFRGYKNKDGHLEGNAGHRDGHLEGTGNDGHLEGIGRRTAIWRVQEQRRPFGGQA